MGLPGHRRTSSHKRRRASHFALKGISTSVCEKCKAPILPHRACKACGWYKGRIAVDTSERRLARHIKAHPVASAVEEKEKKEAAAPKPAVKKAPASSSGGKKAAAKKANEKKAE